MNKNLISVELSGMLVGYSWYNQPISTNFKVTLTPKHEPFTRQWEGFDTALTDIVCDGNFKTCKIACLLVHIRLSDNRHKITSFIHSYDCLENDNNPKFLDDYMLSEKDKDYDELLELTYIGDDE